MRRFPFQALEIDRSFLNGIHEGSNAEIIRAIVSMAKGLSMDVTAEGVETAEQLVSLQKLACQSAQGYFFHKPLARNQARDVLLARGHRARPRAS